MVPRGVQRGRPGPTKSEKVKRSSSRPRVRWSCSSGGIEPYPNASSGYLQKYVRPYVRIYARLLRRKNRRPDVSGRRVPAGCSGQVTPGCVLEPGPAVVVATGRESAGDDSTHADLGDAQLPVRRHPDVAVVLAHICEHDFLAVVGVVRAAERVAERRPHTKIPSFRQRLMGSW